MSTGYCFSKINKIVHQKKAIDDGYNHFQFSYKFFIPEIQKLAFHIPKVQILGTNHYGESCRTALKRHEQFQHVICCRDYAERVVASFANQIQSEYYGGNISVSI